MNSTSFSNRLEAEWADTFTTYEIAWTYRPEPVSATNGMGTTRLHAFSFLLPELKLYVKVEERGTILPGMARSLKLTEIEDHCVLFARPEGEFQMPKRGPLDGPSVLLRCPACGKVFFSSFRGCNCVFCSEPGTQVQDSGTLEWFGYSGPGRPEPRDLPFDFDDELIPGGKKISVPLPEPTSETDESRRHRMLVDQLSEPFRQAPWPARSKIVELKDRYPNFDEVSNRILGNLDMAIYRKEPLVHFPSLLLVGSPSCGKSSYTRALAEILVGHDFLKVDMGQQTPYFSLVGSHQSLRNSREGSVLKLLAGKRPYGPIHNPILLLDEIDKIITHNQFDPLPSLLALLEKNDAREFTDEYYGSPVDASGVNIIAMANDLSTVPAPLLSRFEVIHIPDYTQDQFLDIVIPQIYQEWCAEFRPETFPPTLSEHLRQTIAEQAEYIPRRVKPVLEHLVHANHPELWPRFQWESLEAQMASRQREEDQSIPF